MRAERSTRVELVDAIPRIHHVLFLDELVPFPSWTRERHPPVSMARESGCSAFSQVTSRELLFNSYGRSGPAGLDIGALLG